MRGRSLNVSAASVLAYTPASVYAIEDAIGIKVPDNANIIRNIMLATLWCHDHLVHFYQLAGMDWIDVLDALKADPRKTSELAQSLSSWPKSSLAVSSTYKTA